MSDRTDAPQCPPASAWSEGWELHRLRLFRKCLQIAVRSATPLLPRVAADCDLDLSRAMASLRPDPDWPFLRRRRDVESFRWSAVRRITRRPSDVRHVLSFEDLPSLDAPLQLQITTASVEISLEMGGCLLRTLYGGLYIRLPTGLPESVAVAAEGRPVSDVLAHRWLSDSSWRVLRSRRAGTGMWMVVETGLAPFEMPWPGLCGGRHDLG
ncbi:hypothetical protein KZ813_16985 [Sphingomonas sp. RHCKR7]|uniref:hypothetical protein n=1 Tax=Sphingomonas folli TaxID=2862497 RepID=UPI001CA4EB4F|nr:hypothetical protein [Sphingomonas folli]MBW6528540.1 hypothetical protein [Sphingomonas folli]